MSVPWVVFLLPPLPWIAWRLRIVYLAHRHEGRHLVFSFLNHLKTTEAGGYLVYFAMGHLLVGPATGSPHSVWLRLLLGGVIAIIDIAAILVTLDLDRQLRRGVEPSETDQGRR